MITMLLFVFQDSTKPEETRGTNSFAELFGTPIKTSKHSPNPKPPSSSKSSNSSEGKILHEKLVSLMHYLFSKYCIDSYSKLDRIHNLKQSK